MSNSVATRIKPLARPLSGAARVPGDKSISHRAVLFSAMAEGTSHVEGVLDSQDVRSSIDAAASLGAGVRLALQSDGSFAGEIDGWGHAGPAQPDGAIDCGNSGTTVRLLMGILAPWDVSVELTGDESLRRRPMRRIAVPLELMGAAFSPAGKDTLPLTVHGTSALHGVAYESPVASAQLKTAVLLAGALASGTTTVTEPAPSRAHTELMLPEYGVPVDVEPCKATVRGRVVPCACDMRVPGDPSSAAFVACAALLLPGSDVRVENVSLSATRTGFVRVLARMGADVAVRETGSAGKEPFGTVIARYTDGLRGCEVPAEEFASYVDEAPVLALVAATAEGTTVFRGAGELRVKESDRFAAIIEGLSLLGVRAWGEGDDLFVEGVPGLRAKAATRFDAKGDHRFAMTWALVGLCLGAPVDVVAFESCAVSYPGFLTDIERLAR